MSFKKYWEENKTKLKNCKKMNIYEKILEFFYKNRNIEEGFTISEIELKLEIRGINPKIKKLENVELIKIVRQGLSNKMLVDIDLQGKPCFSRKQIEEKGKLYLTNLKNHSKENKKIKEIIKDKIKQIENNLIGNLKYYNELINKIKDENLFHIKHGYGNLKWRPQRASRWGLNLDSL